MKDKFMKNGVFSLEYDKETLKDMVLELQAESQKQKEAIEKAIEYIKELNEIIPRFWFTELLEILKEVE